MAPFDSPAASTAAGGATLSKVYFSVQLADNATSGPGGDGLGNGEYSYLNETSVPLYNGVQHARALATSVGSRPSAWDTNSILSSGGDDQANFATNGYVVPRTGVYKIDCYVTIRARDSNCGHVALRCDRNPGAPQSLAEYAIGTCLARSYEGESNDYGDATRSETIVWLGQLTQNDVLKFLIRCDNGFQQTNEHKSCFTIVSVD